MSAAPLRFLHAHAMHPEPELALALVWAQLSSQGASTMGATLGWCYLSEELARGAEAMLNILRHHLPDVAWVGGVGAGVLANGVEYIDEPGLVVMLCNLPSADFRVFHGRQPLLPASPLTARAGLWQAHSAQVHADGQTPDLPDLIHELAQRTASGYLFGGVCTTHHESLHIALEPHTPPREAQPTSHADALDLGTGVWRGGLSGVAFNERVRMVSRVTQGCTPVGAQRTITACDRNIVYALDGKPALHCLLHDLGVNTAVTTPDWQREALPKVRATLAGITDASSDLMQHGQHFGADTRVRHLIGLDPVRQGVALSDVVTQGMQLAFCQRHVDAARQDLVRICAELREEFDPTEGRGGTPRGALYVSCAGRGGPHFGAPNAEMAIIAHALGDIPLVGLFAGGEVARQHLYGYTGVLTVFGD